eukprot:GHVL01003747.1.p1 GENE.GHVL01003747.1~~GHVL01003747.1.p1  ORF type:complete len:478 (+),score=68.54 GHVL01003747.1:931-2364(+)
MNTRILQSFARRFYSNRRANDACFHLISVVNEPWSLNRSNSWSSLIADVCLKVDELPDDDIVNVLYNISKCQYSTKKESIEPLVGALENRWRYLPYLLLYRYTQALNRTASRYDIVESIGSFLVERMPSMNDTSLFVSFLNIFANRYTQGHQNDIFFEKSMEQANIIIDSLLPADLVFTFHAFGKVHSITNKYSSILQKLIDKILYVVDELDIGALSVLTVSVAEAGFSNPRLFERIERRIKECINDDIPMLSLCKICKGLSMSNNTQLLPQLIDKVLNHHETMNHMTLENITFLLSNELNKSTIPFESVLHFTMNALENTTNLTAFTTAKILDHLAMLPQLNNKICHKIFDELIINFFYKIHNGGGESIIFALKGLHSLKCPLNSKFVQERHPWADRWNSEKGVYQCESKDIQVNLADVGKCISIATLRHLPYFYEYKILNDHKIRCLQMGLTAPEGYDLIKEINTRIKEIYNNNN